MAKYQKYAEYKDSGIEWLGEIPSHWAMSKLRYLFDFSKGLSITKENLQDEGIPCVNYGEVHSKYGFEVDPRKHPLKCVSESYLKTSENALLNNGDFVFADTSEDLKGSGNFTHLVGDEQIFAGYHTVIARPYDACASRFYAYLFDSKEFRSQIQLAVKGVKVFSITQAMLRSADAWLPSPDEQTQIANFLDHETAKIDSLIAKQEKLIELLKEKRQAVISHAVTKGLNPDVTMKDSGVEWLGQVPEHWEILKFDYAINTVSDIDHYMPNSVDEGIPYVMTGDLQDVVSEIDFESCKKVAYSDYQKLSRKIKTTKDDIIFARYATIGTLSYVDIDKEFLVSYSCVTIKSNPLRTTGKYLSYYLKSQAFLQAIQQQINSNTQGNVGVDSLRNVKIILPLLYEQDAIIDFLKVELSKMDNLIDKAQSAIQLMQERRTALISSAVTGKIDVRNWQNQNHNNNEANTELGA
ncbi:restriction endonuclease subunit S [Acinetobacter sp. YH16042]|uniref:restriction endonuclease subunit S n=1 Tax=Acinetobacter sp. YH16042 TaxID=2601186 RepID=UPI0015D2CDC0|nr:restriction endonuclease subunit S [Acinetobacter sp. YH16042]